MTEEELQAWIREQAAASGLEGPDGPYVVEETSPEAGRMRGPLNPRAGMPWEREVPPEPVPEPTGMDALAMGRPGPELDPEPGPVRLPTMDVPRPAAPPARVTFAPTPDPAAAMARDERTLRNAQRQAGLNELFATIGSGLNAAYGSESAAPGLAALQAEARRPVENARDLIALRQSNRSAQERSRTAATARERAQRTEARAAALRDPASPESAAAQDAFLPVARRFGYEESDVRRMTAETITRIMPSAVSNTGAAVRQETGIAAQTTRQDDAQSHDSSEAELDRELERWKVQLRARPRGGRGGGGGGAGSAAALAAAERVQAAVRRGEAPAAADLAALPSDLEERLNRWSDNARAQGSADAIQGRHEDTQQWRFATRPETLAFHNVTPLVEAAERVVGDASDNEIRAAMLAFRDVSGNRLSLGEFAQLDPRVQEIVGALRRATNANLQDQAGKAMTIPEMVTFGQGIGASQFTTRPALLQGLRSIREALARRQGTIAQGAGARTVRNFTRPSGTPSLQPGTPGGPAPGSREAAAARLGRPLTDDEWARVEAAMARRRAGSTQ